MKKLLLLGFAFCSTLTGCSKVNETMRALEDNQAAIDWSTQAILENRQAIEEANRAIEENRRQLEAINKVLQKASES